MGNPNESLDGKTGHKFVTQRRVCLDGGRGIVELIALKSA